MYPHKGISLFNERFLLMSALVWLLNRKICLVTKIVKFLKDYWITYDFLHSESKSHVYWPTHMTLKSWHFWNWNAPYFENKYWCCFYQEVKQGHPLFSPRSTPDTIDSWLVDWDCCFACSFCCWFVTMLFSTECCAGRASLLTSS